MRKGSARPVTASGLRVEIVWRTGPGVPEVNASALLLVGGRVRSGADLVFYSRPTHPSGAVRHVGRRTAGDTATDVLRVDLDQLEPGVDTVLLAVSAYDGALGQAPGLGIRLADACSGAGIARFDSHDATAETALVLGELAREAGGWVFRAVGRGYETGLAGLTAAHGVAAPEDADRYGAPGAPGIPLRVTLTKDAPSVSLARQGATSGALRVNLNWQARRPPRGLLRRGPARPGLDLDLCALYELTDGSKGVVQALGDAFGALDRPPYIQLDGDDRTGAVDSGENLTVNLDHADAFRRILVFVTVYAGARSFAGLNATVTLRPHQGAPVDFSLDECTVPSTVCALALVTSQGGELVVQREARYLVPSRGVSPQRTVDYAYGWGMEWTPGRK